MNKCKKRKFNTGGNKLALAGNVGAGLAGLTLGSIRAAKAANHNNYGVVQNARNRATLMGNTNYYASDNNGVMDLILNTPTLTNLSYTDIYKTTPGLIFTDMFGAGMTGYGAGKMMTQGLQTPSQPKITGLPTYTGGQAMSDSDFSKLISSEGLEGIINPIKADTSNLKLSFAGGGELFTSGLLKVGTGLVGAGVTMGASAIGDALAKLEAKDLTNEQNALNAFVNSRISHNLLLAVNDSSSNLFNELAKQLYKQGGSMIKPENRGRLTALKKKTGKTEAELYASGNAHTRKMITFARNARKWKHDNGGDLNINGTDFPLNGDYNFIGTGGLHELNPYEGVPQGIATDGNQNLVEQNEVVWNDYVFSNRLKTPKEVIKRYKLKENLTFAQAAEKLMEEAKERPNDPISLNSMEVILSELRDSQELIRMKQLADSIKKEINKMSPEELLQLLTVLTNPQLASYLDLNTPIASCGGYLFAGTNNKGTSLMIKKITTTVNNRYSNVPPSNDPNSNYLWYQGRNKGEDFNTYKERVKLTVLEQENSDVYKEDTLYILDIIANWNTATEELKNLVRSLDKQSTGKEVGVHTKSIFNKDGSLKANASQLVTNYRKDGIPGVWHSDLGREEVPNTIVPGDKLPPKELIPPKTEIPPTIKKETPFNPPTYLTISRYAPVLGNAIGALDALSETPKDYSTNTTFDRATYQPIGDYLAYTPTDTQKYINAINQAGAALDAAIMNASGANRNMAMAQMALANAGRLQAYNEAMNLADQLNFNRLALVAEFNRGTNQFNADTFNRTSLANMQLNELKYNLDVNNQRIRYQVDQNRDLAIGENLTGLFDNLGRIGDENFAINLANWNRALGYYTDPLGRSFYKGVPLETILNEYNKLEETSKKTDTTKKTTSTVEEEPKNTTTTTTTAKYGGLLTKIKTNRRK